MSELLAQKQLVKWREDPAQMIRDLFDTELDDWQKDVCDAFPKHQRIAMQACKGPGKTAVMAMLIWNFLLTRPHPKVVCTSITGANLQDGLWAELSKWQKRSKLLSEAFEWQKERIFLKEHPETWFASARTWPKDGNAEQQANTLAGIHADYVLFVLDEVGGIPDAVMVAAEAALSSGIETKILMAGNPTHRSGPLYRAVTTERHLWYVKEITGDPDDPKRAKRIDPNWARAQIEKYGADNPWVLVNVFGKFPPSSENTLVSPHDVEVAQRRNPPPDSYADAPVILGIDVARYGMDRTVFTVREGPICYEQEVRRGWDTMQTVGYAVHLINKHRPDAVFVDEVGVGAAVVDRLRELGYPVIGVNASHASPDERYYNLRAYMWAKMAEWVKTVGCLPTEARDLARELTSVPYEFASNGKMKIKSKEDLKKDGVPSPDLADSLALTFAYPVAPKARWKNDAALTQRVFTEYNPFPEV